MRFEKLIGYSYTGNVLSLKTGIGLFVASILMGVIGYMIIEDYTLVEALYMTIITISTVGFTEVEPLTSNGRIFTSFLIILNIGIFVYSTSAFTSYVIEGEIFKKMHIRLIHQEIDNLKDHIILCGYGRYGKEIMDHFQQHEIPFVIIDHNPDKIKEIQQSEERILYIEGDATQDDILEKAGISRARALISALPDDADNVFTVLTARQANKEINIISRVKESRTSSKLKLAGADHIIMPEQIGGFYMATLVSKPGAVEFFSFITNEYESDISFEEIVYEKVPHFCRNKTIADLHIRRETGCNIIGYKSPNSRYTVNPAPDTQLIPNSSFIVLGSRQQLEALGKYMDRLAKENV